MKEIRLPGRVAHGAAWVLTLLLTLCLTMTCLGWQAARVLTDASLHEGVALDSRVQSAQMARIEEKVAQLAADYAFQPETIMSLIDEESLADYNRQVTRWWMGLFQPEPELEAPSWDTSAMEQAVREDALFQESTAANMRRTIARDKVAYQAGQAIRRAVLPVRADILAALMPTVTERVNLPALAHGVRLLPALCGAVACLAALLLLAVMHARLSKAALYLGAGLGAAGLCTLGLCLMAGLPGISGLVGQVSSLLALQLKLLGGALLRQAGIFAAAALLLGMGLIALHQRDMRRLCKREGSTQA